jgi:hypothetical protein
MLGQRDRLIQPAQAGRGAATTKRHLPAPSAAFFSDSA